MAAVECFFVLGRIEHSYASRIISKESSLLLERGDCSTEAINTKYCTFPGLLIRVGAVIRHCAVVRSCTVAFWDVSCFSCLKAAIAKFLSVSQSKASI